MTNGKILLIDKPTGWTSHDVVARVRRLTRTKCVGHSGTLDPLATGLLIVLVGREATKKQDEFLKQDKEYECTARLGLATDSYDINGQVISTTDWAQVQKIERKNIEAVAERFQGEITQTVPAFSAVKMKGEKLYEKARKGTIDAATLPSRKIHILSLKVIDFQKDAAAQQTFFTVHVHCSSGTYIRSLVHDIGKALGMDATVVALRRTKIGAYSVEQAQTLEEFAASLANEHAPELSTEHSSVEKHSTNLC